MKPIIIPRKKVASYLGISEDQVALLGEQDPTFPKPIRMWGARSRLVFNTQQLDEWKASRLGLEEVCTCLGNLLQKHGIELTDALQATSGVYLLYKGGVLIYVGQSTNVFRRIPQHHKKDFDRALFLPCAVAVLDVVESALIATLNPKGNGPPPLRDMRLVDLPELVRQYTIDAASTGGKDD